MVSANKFGEINSCTGDSSNIHEALFCVMGHCKFIHSFTHSFVYSMNVCIGSLSCVRHWVDKPKSLSQARSLLSQGWCLVRAHVHAHACVRTHTHTHTQGQFLSRLFLYFQMSWTYSLIWSIFNSIELNFFFCFLKFTRFKAYYLKKPVSSISIYLVNCVLTKVLKQFNWKRVLLFNKWCWNKWIFIWKNQPWALSHIIHKC